MRIKASMLFKQTFEDFNHASPPPRSSQKVPHRHALLARKILAKTIKGRSSLIRIFELKHETIRDLHCRLI